MSWEKIRERRDSLDVSYGALVAEHQASRRNRRTSSSNYDARVVLRQFRSVRRRQVNRDNVENSDLGGEG